MTKKLNVCVIAGGRSPEHEVSIISANNVFKNLDRNLYNVSIIAIEKETGLWRYYGENPYYDEIGNLSKVYLKDKGFQPIFIEPGKNPCLFYEQEPGLVSIDVDVFFPVVHGTNCEDGILQGFLDTLKIPYVGCNTLASAAGMDKDLTKIVAEKHGIKVVPWISLTRHDKLDEDLIISKLGLPLFIKPASSGSSVGVNKVQNKEGIKEAVEYAFKYSSMVMIEKAVPAREIECAVLGAWDDDVKVSVPGEVKPSHDFYSYDAKYIDANGAELIVNAKVTDEQRKTVSKYAESVFRSLRCTGMSRVDFFIHKETGEVFLNEINTIPGFTKISMYPRLWEASGIPYQQLLNSLIDIALRDKTACGR